MPTISVEIELDTDTGQVTVGVEPPDEDEASGEGTPTGPGDPAGPDDRSYMQPAKSVDDALSTAKDLLTNPQAQAAAAGPNQDQMWNRVRRDRQLENQPGVPLMGKG